MKAEDYRVGHVYRKAFTSPSFAWANGLFVFLFIEDNVVYGVDIDKDGHPEMLEEKYSVRCYQPNDEEIHPTKLMFAIDDVKPDITPKKKLYHIKYHNTYYRRHALDNVIYGVITKRFSEEELEKFCEEHTIDEIVIL